MTGNGGAATIAKKDKNKIFPYTYLVFGFLK